MNPRVSRSLGARVARPPASRSRRSRRSSRSATRSTRSGTTSRARRRPASSRSIDYVVAKIPRFAFEKFPRRGRRARHADEVGRRGDGDRPHLQGEPAEGAALARDRASRASSRRSCRRRGGRGRALAQIDQPRPDRLVGDRARRCGAASRSTRSTARSGDRPVVPAQHRSEMVEMESALAAAAPGASASAWLRPRQAGAASPTRGSRRSGARREDEVRALRQRSTACGPSTSASTPARAEFEALHAVPLLDLRGRGRGAPDASARRS